MGGDRKKVSMSHSEANKYINFLESEVKQLEAENAQLKQTNMSLCRDLDEAQRAYENAIGIGDTSTDLSQSIGVDE